MTGPETLKESGLKQHSFFPRVSAGSVSGIKLMGELGSNPFSARCLGPHPLAGIDLYCYCCKF